MPIHTTLRRLWTELRESAARFEHRGVVVTYRGLVVDQTAIVAAIDEACDTLPRGAEPEPYLPRIRVQLCRGDLPGEDPGAPMMAVWTGGLRERGVVRVVAAAGASEAIRDGVHALLMSKIDRAWKAAPVGERVY